MSDVQAQDASSSIPAGSVTRAMATARLANSPAPSGPKSSASPSATPVPGAGATLAPLAGAGSSYDRSGKSALAAALEGSLGSSPTRFGTPPARTHSPGVDIGRRLSKQQNAIGGLDGADELRSSSPWPQASVEDPEIVKRHLVKPSSEDIRSHISEASPARFGSPAASARPSVSATDAPDLDEFSSLQLEGGDVHRQVYRWAEDAEAHSRGSARFKRSKSFHASRTEPESEVLDIHNIKVPGGFRRNFLRRGGASPAPVNRYGTLGDQEDQRRLSQRQQPVILTNNFIEFLTLYGHFAGEDLEDDDEEAESDDYFGQGANEEPGESSALLTPRTPGGRKRRKVQRTAQGTTTPTGAVLLLLKSFVGTGVLFLPRAFLNGGMLFSSLVLVGVAALSYYCFLLLVSTRLRIEGSFGDMGGIIYGKSMRGLILASIVLSQVGFVAAYIVFVSENLQGFVTAVSQCRTWIDIKWMVLMQLVLFLPLSLIRDISKLGFTALVADFFILLGLIYLYYFDIATIAANHGPSDIVNFNAKDWTLFIGTAIFSFEGIGLIVPIQESMRKPSQFPPVLAGVMVLITIIFTSMGALSYAAFGSATKTVVILNLPQDSKFVNAVQFLYSLAILLSTPLQLFPAIRILETELFSRSGKYNPWVKWRKNLFRFCLVMVCALIAWGGAGDLDKFVSLVGSFACVPLVYVYPVSSTTRCWESALTHKQPLLHYKAVATSRLQRAGDIGLAIFGLIGMIYTTTLTISNWAGSADAPNPPGDCQL